MHVQFCLANRASFPWLKIGLVAGLVVGIDAATLTASARSRHYDNYRAAPEKAQQPQADEAAPPSGPLFIVISTGKQRISVYGKDGLYARGPVSTGQPGHPTPLGVFTILGKELFHASNIYSGAPMPFMQRITYSGVAMHEGVLPGYPASHGCIRMPHEFAKRMFGYTKGNERVVISSADVVPANISHPRLPVPKFMPLPGSDNIASGSTQILKNAIKTASGGTKVDIGIKVDGSEGSADSAAQRLLNPLEFAKSMQETAAKNAEQAAAAVNPALQGAADAKARQAKTAALELTKAELVYANAKGRLDLAERALQKTSRDEAAAKTAAEAKLKEAMEALQTAEQTKIAKETAVKNAEEAAAAVNPAEGAVDWKAAKAAALELKKAELAYANAKSRLEVAEHTLQKISREEAIEKAKAAKSAAEATLKQAEQARDAVKRTKIAKDEEAAAAMAAFREADNLRRAAADAVTSWNRRLEPLSIYISRKARRLYIRQAYTKVFDVPIAIRDPEKPIGTHLYVAMPPAQEGPQSALRWLVMTLPEGTSDEDRGGYRRRRSRYDDADDAPRIAQPSASASDALNRIEVPADVAAKISEMIWAGSSLIIADSDVSRETTNYALTDLIVLTH